MNKKEISIELLNKVLGYLGSRPYQEVAGLITEIASEIKTQPKNEKEKK